jgi:2-phosphosulfolactate phosphatase
MVLLDVAFLPADVRQPESSVCIVIDALRASSTIATLFGRGVRDVVVAGEIDEARRLHAGLPGALLCGEEGGLPPAGFDYGNSPVEFDGMNLAGRTVVMATSNGTRALAALAGARAVFVGSLLNLSACARAAAAEATGNGQRATSQIPASPGSDAAQAQVERITVVCAGTELGTRFSLEDTTVAGAFVERLVRDAGARPWQGEKPEGGLRLTDSATAAYRLWRSYPGGARLAFGEATHGQHLVRIGMAADLDFCAQVDRYDVAPRLKSQAALVLTAEGARRAPLHGATP